MKRLLVNVIRIILLFVLVLFGIVVFNTVSYSSRQVKVDPIPEIAIPDKVFDRLGAGIRIPTISREGIIDTGAFVSLDSFLVASYPLADSLLDHRRINRFSHVYHWPGRKAALEPILLIGHLDVVPAEGDQLDRWTVDPFSGSIKDGFLWGRGTLDDKGSCLGLLEAVEMLLAKEYVPERSIYLAFGHDEEIRGYEGAQQIVQHFEQQGIRFAYILDEGMVIVKNALAGLDPPFAGIGIAEKGYATFEIEARLEDGGHSSMPPKETAIGILSKSIYRLQENPLSPQMEGIVDEMFDHIGPEMGFGMKAVFANRWLTGGLLKGQLSNGVASNAMIRTTVAPTILEGGFKNNVLPLSARARVNFRIIPGETVESTLNKVKEIIADERVHVRVLGEDQASDPSPVSPTDGFGFHTVQKTIREVFPEAIVAPSLVIAATDARHYTGLSDQVLRFLPVQLENSDLKRIHGVDERISLQNYKDQIRFYLQLIQNSTR